MAAMTTSQASVSRRPIAWLTSAPVTGSTAVAPRSKRPVSARPRSTMQAVRDQRDHEGGRETSQPHGAGHRCEHGPDRPDRPIGEGRRQRDHGSDLRGGDEHGAGAGQDQGAMPGAADTRLASDAQHEERKDRAAERQRLADEPGGANPYQDQGCHGLAMRDSTQLEQPPPSKQTLTTGGEKPLRA